MRIVKSKKDKLVSKLSEQYGIDPRIVRLIVDYPIKFFRRVSSDDTDIRPVRLRYFGAFVPKQKYIEKYEEELSKKNA